MITPEILIAAGFKQIFEYNRYEFVRHPKTLDRYGKSRIEVDFDMFKHAGIPHVVILCSQNNSIFFHGCKTIEDIKIIYALWVGGDGNSLEMK